MDEENKKDSMCPVRDDIQTYEEGSQKEMHFLIRKIGYSINRNNFLEAHRNL